MGSVAAPHHADQNSDNHRASKSAKRVAARNVLQLRDQGFGLVSCSGSSVCAFLGEVTRCTANLPCDFTSRFGSPVTSPRDKLCYGFIEVAQVALQRLEIGSRLVLRVGCRRTHCFCTAAY
jgi:hypothetical protein